MALKVVRGRGFVGTLALAGGLLLAPAIVWPTWAFRIEEPTFEPPEDNPSEDDPSTTVVLQLFWAWGRFATEVTPLGDRQPPEPFPTPGLSLAIRIALVLAAVVGAVVWLWARGERARLVGLAGIVAGWAVSLQAISGRVTFMTLFSFGEGSGEPTTEIVTFGAGTAENAALVILSFALLVLLTRPVAGIAAAAWRKGSAWAAERRIDDDEDDEPRRATVAVIRDASPGEIGRSKDGTLPGRAGGGYPAADVGFSDAPPDDERFRPR